MERNFIKIGQVLKSNGTDGQVVIRLFDYDTESFDFDKEPVFIFFDELPVPYFVEVAEERGATKILAYLTDVQCLEDAEELVGKSLYIPDSDEAGEDGIMDFTGWTLYDASGRDGIVPVGKITDFEDIPGNPCIDVDTESGTVLVPLHEDLITSKDEKSRTLVMNIPEGLL